MISFYGRLYNVTTGLYEDSAPQQYTIGYYYGNEIQIGDDGTTRTDIPASNFELSYGSNMGCRIEEAIIKYRLEHGDEFYPVLRILTSNDKEDYYFEWEPGNSSGFNLKYPGGYSRWDTTTC